MDTAMMWDEHGCNRQVLFLLEPVLNGRTAGPYLNNYPLTSTGRYLKLGRKAQRYFHRQLLQDLEGEPAKLKVFLHPDPWEDLKIRSPIDPLYPLYNPYIIPPIIPGDLIFRSFRGSGHDLVAAERAMTRTPIACCGAWNAECPNPKGPRTQIMGSL